MNAPSIRHAPPFATPIASPKNVEQLYETDYATSLINDTGLPNILYKYCGQINGHLMQKYGQTLIINIALKSHPGAAH